jgi:hypothetical protein
VLPTVYGSSIAEGPQMTDLEAASTDDLIRELFSRFDHCVFAGHQVLAVKGDSGPQKITRRWKGCTVTVAGLCAEAQRASLADLDIRSAG